MHRKSKVMSKAVALFLCTTMVLPMASYYGNVSPVYGQEVGGGTAKRPEGKIKVGNIKVIDADTSAPINDELVFSFRDIGNNDYEEKDKDYFKKTSKNGELSDLEFKLRDKFDDGTMSSGDYKLNLESNNKYEMDEIAFSADDYFGEARLNYQSGPADKDENEYIVSIKLKRKKDGASTNESSQKKKVEKTRSLISLYSDGSRVEDETLEFIIKDSESKIGKTHPGDTTPIMEIKKDLNCNINLEKIIL